MRPLYPQLIFFADSTLLEGPIWDSKNNVIFCVSIDQSMVYLVNLASGYIKTFTTDGPVGCAVLEPEGTLLSAENSGIYRINPTNGERVFFVQLEPDSSMRYNDGKLDPRGRFLIGTKGLHDDIPGKGKLYSYYEDKFKIITDRTTISNGLGFSISGNCADEPLAGGLFEVKMR